jgi:membrane protease YdiL (CAAX protease family)
LLANVVIGIGVAVWALRLFVASNIRTAKQLGFRSLKRTSIALLIAFAVGGGLFLLQSLPSTDPLVLFNGFAQVLPVSIAEVVVCWAVIGGSFEAWAQSKGKVTGIIGGIVAANFLFGLYHFAHSAPFNQVWMVFFLMIPGLVTSLVYFLGRDLYATIILHNFLGMTGVMQNVDLDRFSQPLYHLYILLIVSVAVLMIADNYFIRRLRGVHKGES